MKRLAAGMFVVPVLVAAACDSSRTATPRPPHRKPAGRPMWWYHGYPPHDEIRLRGDVHSVVVGLGKVWALESDLKRGVTRLVRIDPRRDSVDRRAALRPFEPPLAVGAGLVWTLSGTRCRGSSGGSCAAVGAIDPKTLRRISRTVVRTGLGATPTLLTVGAGAVWLSNTGDLSAASLGRGTVWRLDPRTKRIVARIALPRAPLALAADRGRLWIADSSGTLRALDRRTNRLLPRAVPLGPFPSGALAAASGRVWAATPGALVEVDARTGSLVRRIHFRSPLLGEIAARGDFAWVATTDGNVVRVDARTGHPGRALPLRRHQGLAAAAAILWTSRGDAVIRIANWPGWDAHAKAPRCAASQLHASTFFQGATGSLAGGLTLRNRSRTACTLVGFPRLRTTDARGRRLPITVGHVRPHWEFSTAPGNWPFQTVRPGKASGFDVWWSNWCGPPARVVFHVLLPGGERSAAWSTGPRCDAPGYPSTVTISPYGGGLGL